jgi:hypothetical protein
VLRARRNDRRLIIGDGHVRNGDRFQVLGPGPQDGLIVEDLTGRGRTVLPAAYLAEHAEYGWASTIDAAQGATADIGVVLVRPGMDREHLYVAMTRGRRGNHAYITPDPSIDDDHHDHGHPHQQHPAAVADPQEQAVRVLEAALARSGAQDAAHTALEQARTHAKEQATQTARQDEQRAERAAARAAAAEQRQRRQTRPLLPEHTRALRLLEQCRADTEQLHADRTNLRRTLHDTRTALEALPRWARGRRRALTETITSTEQQLRQTEPTQGSLDAELDRLTRQVAHHTRQHLASDLAEQHIPRPDRWDLDRTGLLPWRTPGDGPEPATLGLPRGREPYRGAERDLGDGLSR